MFAFRVGMRVSRVLGINLKANLRLQIRDGFFQSVRNSGSNFKVSSLNLSAENNSVICWLKRPRWCNCSSVACKDFTAGCVITLGGMNNLRYRVVVFIRVGLHGSPPRPPGTWSTKVVSTLEFNPLTSWVICAVASPVRVASVRTSSATTAKPRPCSRAGRFDGRVKGEQIGLIGNGFDAADN